MALLVSPVGDCPCMGLKGLLKSLPSKAHLSSPDQQPLTHWVWNPEVKHNSNRPLINSIMLWNKWRYINLGGGGLKDVQMGWEVDWENNFVSWPLISGEPQLSFPLAQKPQLGGSAWARTDYCEFTHRVITYHELWKCAHVTCKANKKHPAKHDHDKTTLKIQLHSERLFTKMLVKEYAHETLRWQSSQKSVPVLGSKGSTTP